MMGGSKEDAQCRQDMVHNHEDQKSKWRTTHTTHQALCTSAYVPLHTQPPRLHYEYNTIQLTSTTNDLNPPLLRLTSHSVTSHILLDQLAPQISADPNNAVTFTPQLRSRSASTRDGAVTFRLRKETQHRVQKDPRRSTVSRVLED
jgi:hypothetical protein